MLDLKIETTFGSWESGSQGLQQRRDRKRSYVDVDAFPNALFRGKKDRVIDEKIQEVENAYNEYTVEIFEVEFQINLISSSMREIDVMIDTDWSSWN
ncbi:hypothetical protein OSB04_031838 [Centaurea solstitialis]|uniref:Uncharacterized protein n=1 Tax=Centaurea solstitialis TaxID=347529 RepID=A0AA38W545_9ASTR|nr:hypothetical protein OSB04_031838 [Centaurea solstitialis]